MKDSFKPLNFTIFTATFITVVSQVVLSLLMYSLDGKVNYRIILIFSLFIFLTVYLLMYLYFKHYIFRNINAILNSITGREKDKIEKKPMNFRENVIQNINEQVRLWNDENKKEIDQYKILSDYRKQFLGDISHELKTPLFSVQGYLHTLLDGALYDNNNNVIFLQKAIKNAERLEAIVRDLDMISRLEAGEIIFNPVNFSIRKLFREVFEELEFAASRKQIILGFKSENPPEIIVFADPNKIRHVLLNLVSNGIHYGKIGGFVKVGCFQKNGRVIVEVSDNGIGIPEKHLVHLFDRFYRIDASRSRNKGGSGLGLSIVKHILKGHGQTIRVQSKPEKGSTFTFTLNPAKTNLLPNE